MKLVSALQLAFVVSGVKVFDNKFIKYCCCFVDNVVEPVPECMIN